MLNIFKVRRPSHVDDLAKVSQGLLLKQLEVIFREISTYIFRVKQELAHSDISPEL